jgi:hypothetical protein
MKLISQNEIQTLIRKDGGHCVSIYMPTVRVGDTQQNKIRLKNLLRQAEERLTERGMRESEAAELLTPARRLLDDQTWWEHQGEGLAIFLANDTFETFRLPIGFEEHVSIEDRFQLQPLFPLFNGDGHFYVLCLTKRDIRLLSCHRFDCQEVDLGEMPSSFTEVMGVLTRQETIQVRSTGKSVAGGSIFHGHGGTEDDLKAELLKYFNLVDDNLNRQEIEREAPFVLAGVEYLLPRFKEATNLPNVLEQGLTGNPEGLSAEELHTKAWEIVEPWFLQDQKRAAERFGELQGTGRASHDIKEILPAALDGRIDSIFAAQGARVWGQYNQDTREIKVLDQDAARNGSEDLLDRAVVQTYLNGGKVFAVDPQEVPEGHSAVAIFRY